MYYAKARYYDAEIGRFVSEDSYRGNLRDLVNLNLYGYVKNNPVKYTDPSGNIAIADDAIIILLFLVAGTYYSLEVSAAYLKTPEGQEALKNAKEFIYNGKKYLKVMQLVYKATDKLQAVIEYIEVKGVYKIKDAFVQEIKR